MHDWRKLIKCYCFIMKWNWNHLIIHLSTKHEYGMKVKTNYATFWNSLNPHELINYFSITEEANASFFSAFTYYVWMATQSLPLGLSIHVASLGEGKEQVIDTIFIAYQRGYRRQSTAFGAGHKGFESQINMFHTLCIFIKWVLLLHNPQCITQNGLPRFGYTTTLCT